MAKVVKDTRQTIDVEEELTKIKSNKKSTKNKKEKEVEKKKTSSKKDTKNKNSKKTKKNKKRSRVVTFFKEVKSEVSKVKWPSKKDMVKYSLATIIFVVFFALFFYAIDAIIALLKEVI